MSFDYDIVFPCACCGNKSTNYLCAKCAKEHCTSCSALRARLEAAEAAIRGLNALIIEAQETMTAYLVPDGIEADVAIERVIELLDGPRQREAQKAAFAVLSQSPEKDKPCD